jgi:hypothetical protein
VPFDEAFDARLHDCDREDTAARIKATAMAMA